MPATLLLSAFRPSVIIVMQNRKPVVSVVAPMSSSWSVRFSLVRSAPCCSAVGSVPEPENVLGVTQGGDRELIDFRRC